MSGMAEPISNVAVLGAGIMGHGIAQVFAQSGKTVVLVDSVPRALESARKRIESSVQMLRQNGILSAAEANEALRHLTFTTQLEEAAGAAEIVFEAIPENLALKQQLIQKLDDICAPGAIFCSNSSAIPPTRLARASRNPERVVGTHFFNPAQLIPLVEVITSDRTAPAVLTRVMELLSAVGKKPIHVRKDLPGFIANRLQHALAREAISLVAQQVATPEDIDTVVKNSIALRLLFSGPVEQRDLNGLDTYLGITETLYPDLADMKEAPPLAREMVARGELGLKTGKGFYDWSGENPAEVARRKNQQLIELLKFLQAGS